MVTSRLEAGSVAGGDMSFPGQQPEYADTARLRRIPVKKSTLPETIVQPSTLAADAALVGDQAAEDMPPIKRRRTRFEEVAKGISAVLDEAKELMEEIPVASHQDMQQTISDTTYRSSGRPQPIQIASSIDTAVKEFNSPVTKNDYSPLNKLFGLDSSPSQTTTQPQLKIV